MITKPHWGAAVADAVVARAEADTAHTRAAVVARTSLERAVTTEGLAFVDRLGGEAGAAVQMFNQRIGRAVLSVHRSPNNVVSVTHHDVGAVSFVADLYIGDGNEPAVTVTVRRMGSGSVTPYRFDVQGERLHVVCAGVVMNPEQFVRAHLEPWLHALPLGGR